MKKLRDVAPLVTSIRWDARTYLIIQAIAKSNFMSVSAAVRKLARDHDDRMRELAASKKVKTKKKELVDA